MATWYTKAKVDSLLAEVAAPDAAIAAVVGNPASATSIALDATYLRQDGIVWDALRHGILGNATELADARCVSGQTTVYCPGAVFTSADVGKKIAIAGAGAAGGGLTSGASGGNFITAVVDAENIIMTAPAGTSTVAPRTVTNGVTTRDSQTLTSATAAFTAGDVGKTVTIALAGEAGRRIVTERASITTASTTLSAIYAVFTAGMVGLTMKVAGAGASGAPLYATVVSVAGDGKSCVLSAAASTTMAGWAVVQSYSAATLTTVITLYTNPTTVELRRRATFPLVGATVTISGHSAVYGTDDLPAWQALTNLVSAGDVITMRRGHMSLLGGGTWTIDRPVTFRFGHRSSSVLHYGLSSGRINASSDGVVWENVGLKGLRANGLLNMFATKSSGALHCKDWRFSDCRWDGVRPNFERIGATQSTNVLTTTGSDFSSHIVLDNPEITGCAADGALYVYGTDDVTVNNPWVHDNGQGPSSGDQIKVAAGARNFRVAGGVSEWGARDGIDCYDAIDADIDGLEVRHNQVYGLDLKWVTTANYGAPGRHSVRMRAWNNGGGANVSSHFADVDIRAIANRGNGLRVGGAADTNTDLTVAVNLQNVTALGNDGAGVFLSYTKNLSGRLIQSHGNALEGVNVQGATLMALAYQAFGNGTTGCHVYAGCAQVKLAGYSQDPDGIAVVDAGSTGVTRSGLPSIGKNAITGWWHAEGYGAVMNGVADIGVAVNLAIADCVAAGGGTVYLGNGTGKVDTMINLSNIHPLAYQYNTGPGVTLRGNGKHETVLIGGETAYGVIELVGSNRITIESMSLQPTGTVQFGILAGRKAGDGSSGEHTFRDLTIYGAFTAGGLFAMSSEICNYERMLVYATAGPCMVLARDLTGFTGVVAKYTALSATAAIVGGNGVNRFSQVTLLNISTTATDVPLTLEYLQAFTADNLYIYSEHNTTQILMRKLCMGATFTGLQQEYGTTRPLGFLFASAYSTPSSPDYRGVHIRSGRVLSIKGEDTCRLVELVVDGAEWRGADTWQIDVDILYNSSVKFDSRATSTAIRVTNPQYKVRSISRSNEWGPVDTAPLTAPTITLGTTSGSGGTFVAGTYYWVVAATNVYGETITSNQVTAVLATNGTQVINWTTTLGATGYKVFRSQTSGTYTGSTRVASLGIASTYTDTGTAPAAASPVTIATAGYPSAAYRGFGAGMYDTFNKTPIWSDGVNWSSPVAQGQMAADAAQQAGVDPTGVNECAAALQTFFDACAASGVRAFARGTFKIGSTVTIKGSCDLSDATFNYTGTTIAVIVGATGSQTWRKRISLPTVNFVNKPGTGWTASTIGVRVTNMNQAQITFPMITGFEIGLQVYAQNAWSSSYNEFRIGSLANNKVNLDVNTDGSAAYCNQNLFIGGGYSHFSSEGTNVAGTRHIRLNALTGGSANPNNNLWVNSSLESPTVVEYVLEINGTYNKWDNCRWEYTAGTPKVLWGAAAVRNQIYGGNNVDAIVETWTAGSGYNTIVGTNGARFMAASSPGVVFVNDGSSAFAGITLMAAGTVQAGTSTTTGYAGRLEAFKWRGKTTADTVDRVLVDISNKKIAFSSGSAAADIEIGRSAAGVLLVNLATTGTTAPAAGGADALPATPAGYLTVNINGTDRKLPYY